MVRMRKGQNGRNFTYVREKLQGLPGDAFNAFYLFYDNLQKKIKTSSTIDY